MSLSMMSQKSSAIFLLLVYWIEATFREMPNGSVVGIDCTLDQLVFFCFMRR